MRVKLSTREMRNGALVEVEGKAGVEEELVVGHCAGDVTEICVPIQFAGSFGVVHRCFRTSHIPWEGARLRWSARLCLQWSTGSEGMKCVGYEMDS